MVTGRETNNKYSGFFVHKDAIKAAKEARDEHNVGSSQKTTLRKILIKMQKLEKELQQQEEV